MHIMWRAISPSRHFLKGLATAGEQQQIFKIESNLHQIVDALFTCSQEDKDLFNQMNLGKLPITVIPNGMIIPAARYDAGVHREVPLYILFCGSLSSVPNAEGLYWFANNIWPIVIKEFPALKLLFVGSGIIPQKYEDVVNIDSIDVVGAVPDVKRIITNRQIAVVPLLTGSGTRLKF